MWRRWPRPSRPWAAPSCVTPGPRSTSPVRTSSSDLMNQLGLTHLSLRVDDVETVASTIEALGGTVVRDTRTTFDVSGAHLEFRSDEPARPDPPVAASRRCGDGGLDHRGPGRHRRA